MQKYERERQLLPEKMKKEKATQATMYIAGILEPEARQRSRRAGIRPGDGLSRRHSRADQQHVSAPRRCMDRAVKPVDPGRHRSRIRETNTVQGRMPMVDKAAVKQLVRIVISKDYIQPKGPPHLNIEQAKTADTSGTAAAPADAATEDGSSPAPTDASSLKAVGAFGHRPRIQSDLRRDALPRHRGHRGRQGPGLPGQPDQGAASTPS